MKDVAVTLLFVAVLAGLLGWESRLEAEANATRATTDRIGRLILPEERAGMAVAAVRLTAPREGPDGERSVYTYTQVGPLWRCLEYSTAVASQSAVEGMVEALLDAEGVVQGVARERESSYGLGTAATWTITFLGTAKEVLFEVDVGSEVEGLDGCFARRWDRDAIWSLDRNLRTSLDQVPVAGLPPLLDPAIVPSAWPGGSNRRIERIDVQRADGQSYALRLDRIELSQEEMLAGKSPYKWMMLVGESELDTSTALVSAFASLLVRAPYVDVLSAEVLPTLGLDRSRAKLVLHPAEGEPLEIFVGPGTPVVGPPRPGVDPERVAVYHAFSGTPYQVTEAVATLLSPAPAALLPQPGEDEEAAAQRPNPWMDVLRAAQR